MMNKFNKTCTLLMAFLLYSPFALHAAGLVGNWQCQGESGPASLEFRSNNLLAFNGEEAQYALAPGVIRVQEDVGIVEYPYVFKGKDLVVTFPDGSRLQCARAESGKAGQKGGAASGREQGGEGNHLLRGTLCSWSGSSTGSTSYSSSNRVTFDGQGRFAYGSESSFSGSAGQAFSAGPGSGGAYRVVGNKVHITFSDGSTGVATVNFRLNDGRISELMYNGKLYGMGLCE